MLSYDTNAVTHKAHILYGMSSGESRMTKLSVGCLAGIKRFSSHCRAKPGLPPRPSAISCHDSKNSADGPEDTQVTLFCATSDSMKHMHCGTCVPAALQLSSAKQMHENRKGNNNATDLAPMPC